MKRTQKTILTTLTLLTFSVISNGCAPKNADGTYHSAYSYHPYNTKKHNTHRALTRNLGEPVSSMPRHQVRHVNSYGTTSKGEAIEHVAKSLLGTDYQYGANGPYQYDCSSFTKYVFSKNGITLPRVSRDQAKVGQYVRANELQKGDLIFFSSKKSSGVAHVGIYLGRGNFIHASSAKDQVTISNLSSNYYSKHFKWGRRVTNRSYASR